ncbi:hypothetical protein V6Z11_D04G183800 [Gossypium hirsutum]
MESEFLSKVKDNAVIRIWSEKSQLEKGDSLTIGFASELWDYTSINVTQNNLQELKEIWAQWEDEVKQLFYYNYGDLPYLLDINVDEHLFRALAQFWNSAYSCFTFGEVDMVPTVEEYTTLLRCLRIQVDKVSSRTANVSTFTKKLTRITGMSEQWVTARIKQNGENRCIPWRSLRDHILAHPDTKKKVDVFALSMYGLVIFPKALGHIDEAVTDLFDQLDRRVTPVSAILAETFRSLSACRRTGEGRFVGCAQLLLVWFHSHFWKVDKISYQVFSENYSSLKELAATPRRNDITKEKWMTILHNLRDEDGAVGYAPLLVLRQYKSRQFIPAMQGLAECEFSYKGNNYKGKIREMSNAWKRIHQMKRIIVGATKTPEYHGWRSKRIDDNIPKPREECGRPIEEHLRIVPSELEIIKQDFEKRSSEFGKRIEQLEEEKMRLGLDVDIHKLEAEKWLKRTR